MSANSSASGRFHPLGSRTSHPAPQTDGRVLLGYQTLVLSMALVVIYANLPIYGYVLYPALLPKYSFFALFFLMAPLALIKYRDWGAYLASPFALWAAVFFVLNIIHLMGFSQSIDLGGIQVMDSEIEARRSLIMTRAQYVLFSIFLGFIVYTSTNRVYMYMMVCLMTLLPCMIMFDFTHPGVVYPSETNGAVLGRAAAMFINPTMAGEAILLVFLLGCAVTQLKYRAPLFLLTGAAIMATFSRSSIIAWVLIMGILIVKKTLPRSTLIWAAIAAGVFLAFLGNFENYLHSRQELDGAASNILSRLDFFSTFTFDDDSSEERADVITAGWELFLQNPVFGGGAGATEFWLHRASTHNQFLLFAAEYGIFGIGLWTALLVILLRGNFFEDRGLQFAVAFLFVFMSMFTHQMFDSAFYWLATFTLISVRRNRTGVAPIKKMQNHT